MTIVLAIETSSETASVALLQNDEILVRQSTGVATHSQTVLPMIQALLAESGMSIGRCSVIAFGAGPGSFTGVRTACGVAQGLAFGADLPVAPVVTLKAMALALWRSHPDASSVIAMLDARMGEIYWAQYREAEAPVTVAGPSLSRPEEVLGLGAYAVCGNALSAYPEALSTFAKTASHRLECLPHASDVALLGLSLFQQGRVVPAQDAQPLYLRNKVAQTIAEREARATT